MRTILDVTTAENSPVPIHASMLVQCRKVDASRKTTKHCAKTLRMGLFRFALSVTGYHHLAEWSGLVLCK